MNAIPSKHSDGVEFVNYFAANTWAKKTQVERLQEFKQMYHDLYLPNFHVWSRMYARAYEHLALYCGDQLSPEEIERRKEQRRSALVWNHVYRNINTIAGYFEQSQLGYMVQSVNPDQTSTQGADILNDCLRRVCYQEEVYKKIAGCVKDAAITGWTGLRAYIDSTPEGRGDIKVRQVFWNNLVIDPMFTQIDLSDCAYIAVRSLLPRSKLAAMFPEHAGMILSIKPNVSADMKFPWTVDARSLYLQHPDTLNYTEMYRMVARPEAHVYNPKTKESARWTGTKEEWKQLKSVEPQLQLKTLPVSMIEYGILIEDQLVKFAENPYNINVYPIQPFFAKFEPSYALDRKVDSLVSIIADAQRSYNKRKNALLDILDTSLQSGVIYKDGAVLNPESLYMVRAGHNICIQQDVPISEAVQQIASTDLPASIFQTIKDLENDLNTLLGVNPEMLGQLPGGNQGDVEVSGVLYRMKQASALVGMQPFYSLIRESQHLFGNLLLKMIQANYSVEKMARISQKTPPVEIVNKEWAKFNIVLQEGLIENRNASLEQKIALRALGVPVDPRSFVEDAPLYDKAKLLEYIDRVEQEQSQIRKVQLQKELLTVQNLAQDLQSEASKNQAFALSTLGAIGLKAAEKEEALARTQKIEAEAIEKYAHVLEMLASVPPEQLQAGLNFMSSMSQGIQKAVNEKKEICERDADEAIARRLPPQDLSDNIEAVVEGIVNPQDTEIQQQPIA